MSPAGLSLSQLDFEYPENLVATERSPQSRIMLAGENNSQSEIASEITKSELLGLFQGGDLWVVNETRVLKRRVFTNEGLEILFIRSFDPDRREWEVLCPSSRWKQGTKQTVTLDGETIAFELTERGRPQRLRADRSMNEAIFIRVGELPLPPYIQKARGERHTRAKDDSDYQSIWASEARGDEGAGSLAAPTASFHFDHEFEKALEARGVRLAKVTLHVGLGTFLPVTVENLNDHVMHAEFAEVPVETQKLIEATKARGGRVIAVGTTVTRTLEAMALNHFQRSSDGGLSGETALLIQPGHQWQVVDVLLTNFHQPKSTLLALVAAFAGLDRVHAAYKWAIENKYRLFSYGDLSVWFRK